MNFKFLIILSLFVLVIPFMVLASETDGTLSGYAWSPQVGWVNFGTTNGAAAINDNTVSGYAWNTNVGWINLAPTNSGVTNDAEGNLSGRAWSTGMGYINFSGVTVSSAGAFSGTATGDNMNIIFGCTNCNVTTDWRPSSSRVASGGGLVYDNSIVNIIPVAPSLPEEPDNSSGSGGGSSNDIIKQLREQIAQLLAQINVLLAKQNKSSSEIVIVPVSPNSPVTVKSSLKPASLLLTKNILSLYSVDNEVKALQKFLNNNGFILAAAGPGALGNETNIFGPRTQAALAKFQEAYFDEILKPSGFSKGTGWVGPYSRSFINSIFK